MKSKTDTTKRAYRHALPKLVKSLLMLLLFAITTAGYAQDDSCYVYPHFFVATTDYKNITITDNSGGNNLAYVWNFGDGTSSTNPNPGTHVYSSSTTHIISLTLTDTVKACVRVFSDTISIPCNANFSFTYNQHDFNFTANTSMNPSTSTFAWDFGDGSTSTIQTPSHHYVNTGSYKACLTVTSTLDATCSDTKCGNVIVQDTISNDDSTLNVCSAQYTYYRQSAFSYSFHATQNDRNYLWDFGDGTTSTLQYADHTFPSNKYYNVCLTVTSKTGIFCTNKYCNVVDVTIPKYCNSFFTITADSSTTDPYDFLIYNLSSGNNLTYLWNFGDGATSTLPNPTHDYAGTGPYFICLTVENDSCHDTHCDTLDLSDTLHHFATNKFHVTVIDKTVTGIKKNDVNKVTLLNYPNPFSGSTTINYSIATSSAVELVVYNLLGVKVETIEGGTKAPGNYTLDWDAQHLQEGIYLLQLKANDQLITKKIIIHK